MLSFQPRILALVMAVSAVGIAAAQAPLPPVKTSGAIQYLSGGIGSDESQAIDAIASQWPLTLEFAVNANPKPTFAADVAVTIRNGADTVFQTTATGPFLLVKLPPGNYKVDAVFKGQTVSHPVTVTAGKPARQSFLWPAQP